MLNFKQSRVLYSFRFRFLFHFRSDPPDSRSCIVSISYSIIGTYRAIGIYNIMKMTSAHIYVSNYYRSVYDT